MIKATSIRNDKAVVIELNEPEWFDPMFFEHNDNLFKKTITKNLYKKTASQLTPEDIQGSKSLNLGNKIKLTEKDQRYESIIWWFHQVEKVSKASRLPEVYRYIELIDIHFCKGEKNN